MGHMGENYPLSLHSKGINEGIFGCSLDFDFYKHCLYAKQNQVGSHIFYKIKIDPRVNTYNMMCLVL